MKPVDVYTAKVLSVKNSVYDIESHVHNELSLYHALDYNKIEESGKIEVKNHYYYQIDYRRYASMSSVWFEGSPIMIVQNAGREGRDHEMRFITDDIKYKLMINFIRSCVIEDSVDVYDLNEEIEELSNFYGYSLSM